MRENVVGYVRVSTYGRAKEGYSLTYQLEEIERYCRQHGLELLHVTKTKASAVRPSMKKD